MKPQIISPNARSAPPAPAPWHNSILWACWWLLKCHPLTLRSHKCLSEPSLPALETSTRGFFPSPSLHLFSIPFPPVIYSSGGQKHGAEQQAPCAFFIKICRLAANYCSGSSALPRLGGWSSAGCANPAACPGSAARRLRSPGAQGWFFETLCSGITSNQQEN